MKLDVKTLILCLGAIFQPTLDAKAEQQIVDPFYGRWVYNGPDSPTSTGDQQLRAIVFESSIGDSLATFSIWFEGFYPVTACYYSAVREGTTLTSIVLNNVFAVNYYAGGMLEGTESDCPTFSSVELRKDAIGRSFFKLNLEKTRIGATFRRDYPNSDFINLLERKLISFPITSTYRPTDVVPQTEVFGEDILGIHLGMDWDTAVQSLIKKGYLRVGSGEGESADGVEARYFDRAGSDRVTISWSPISVLEMNLPKTIIAIARDWRPSGPNDDVAKPDLLAAMEEKYGPYLQRDEQYIFLGKNGVQASKDEDLISHCLTGEERGFYFPSPYSKTVLTFDYRKPCYGKLRLIMAYGDDSHLTLQMGTLEPTLIALAVWLDELEEMKKAIKSAPPRKEDDDDIAEELPL